MNLTIYESIRGIYLISMFFIFFLCILENKKFIISNLLRKYNAINKKTIKISELEAPN